MKCPYCGNTKSKVVDKRDKDLEGVTRRRRECIECARRYTTYETIENIDLVIEKRDGTIESYNRKKLGKSISKALSSSKFSDEDIEKTIDAVEMSLLALGEKQLESKKVGDIVLENLYNIEPVAYMRFTSVFKHFETIEDFRAEIEGLDKSAALHKKLDL